MKANLFENEEQAIEIPPVFRCDVGPNVKKGTVEASIKLHEMERKKS